jgi:8-oxo-dGTP pyrophosphatase MutT (NUDIX family)
MIETESAGGIITKNGLVLVVSQHGTSWSLPKGHLEKGEDKISAAKREIYEETGISDVEMIKELGNYKRYKIEKDGSEDKSELKTIYMFLFRTDKEIIKPIDPENPEARWVPKEHVAEILTHPKDKEFYLSVMNEI